MMRPLNNLPMEFQRDWGADLLSSSEDSAYRLVNIHRAEGKGYQGQRLTVQVLDINGFPLPNVPVAFSYSTARPYFIADDFFWQPPPPRRADIYPTNGGGMIDHIQGSVVKDGEPGGVTVYIFDPNFPSDVVSGMGMLADHTGVILTFQRQIKGEIPLDERLGAIEKRLSILEAFRPA